MEVLKNEVGVLVEGEEVGRGQQLQGEDGFERGGPLVAWGLYLLHC